jgi:hypothetical protein
VDAAPESPTRILTLIPLADASCRALQLWKSYAVRAAVRSRATYYFVVGVPPAAVFCASIAPHSTPSAPPRHVQYTRNQRVQQLSPFEVDVLGPLFRNVGEKVKHKLEVRSRLAATAPAAFRYELGQMQLLPSSTGAGDPYHWTIVAGPGALRRLLACRRPTAAPSAGRFLCL